MRNKDVAVLGAIFENEMKFASPFEVEGIKASIKAIKGHLSYTNNEPLDMAPLDAALMVVPMAWGNPCFICQEEDDHGGLPHGVITGDGLTQASVKALSDESHLIRGRE